MDDTELSEKARTLRDSLEPVIGSVYFAPECHQGYEKLGFAGSSGTADGVEMPDGPAYFTSRGSCLGLVPGMVVASAFGVFNPVAVEAAVDHGRQLTDPETIAAIRLEGAANQLRRVLPDADPGRTTDLLLGAADGLRPESRHLYGGLRARPEPTDPWERLHWAGDLLREYRGDSHNAAWITAGIDATEIGLLTELWWGLPTRTYVRTRAWSEAELDAAEARLEERGAMAGGRLTEAGTAFRESIEAATDRQCRPMIENLGDDYDELVTTLRDWSVAVIAAQGYPPSARKMLRLPD